MSNKIKISDELNKSLNEYIEKAKLGGRSKSIVAEYAIRSFLSQNVCWEFNLNKNDYSQNFEIRVPPSLLEEIKSAQLIANKKISEALKRKKNKEDFEEMTGSLKELLKDQSKGPYVQQFPFIGRR